jgi:hypothetical protein
MIRWVVAENDREELYHRLARARRLRKVLPDTKTKDSIFALLAELEQHIAAVRRMAPTPLPTRPPEAYQTGRMEKTNASRLSRSSNGSNAGRRATVDWAIADD